MTKKTQQPTATPAQSPDLTESMPALRAPLGPFEIEEYCATDSGVLLNVDGYDGADSYQLRETLLMGNGEVGPRFYRTVQRLDLATRLQLPNDYDPADLVGRVFLVEA